MTPLVSVCVLSFNRRELLENCLLSIRAQRDVRIELLVGDDGSGFKTTIRDWLIDQLELGLLSGVYFAPPARNEGVGRMVNRLFSLASGDFLVKCDQDVEFIDTHALRKMVKVAGSPTVGTVGGFRYWHDPVDHDKMRVAHYDDYEVVKDYVSSVMMIRRDVWAAHGPWEQHSDAFAEDIDFKHRLAAAGFEHALTAEDVILNENFGPGPSTVVYRDHDGSVGVQAIYKGPALFGRQEPEC